MSATKEFSVGGCPSPISWCFHAGATTTQHISLHDLRLSQGLRLLQLRSSQNATYLPSFSLFVSSAFNSFVALVVVWAAVILHSLDFCMKGINTLAKDINCFLGLVVSSSQIRLFPHTDTIQSWSYYILIAVSFFIYFDIRE